MSLGLHICCDCVDPTTGKDCQNKIHGEEAIDLHDLRYPMLSGGSVDLGHKMIMYGQGLEDDLNAAALAAGWHWDGREWRCKECKEKAIEVLAASYDALDTEALMAELTAGSLPTVAKLEAVARLMNV
jgi:hypothetical protein